MPDLVGVIIGGCIAVLGGALTQLHVLGRQSKLQLRKDVYLESVKHVTEVVRRFSIALRSQCLSGVPSSGAAVEELIARVSEADEQLNRLVIVAGSDVMRTAMILHHKATDTLGAVGAMGKELGQANHELYQQWSKTLRARAESGLADLEQRRASLANPPAGAAPVLPHVWGLCQQFSAEIFNWLPVFASPACCDILVGALDYCRAHKQLQLYGWVTMDTHFHAVVGAPELSAVVADLKKFTARRIVEQLERERRGWLLDLLRANRAAHKTRSLHQVWQEGFHPQAIQDDAMMRQKLEYLHNNPVRRGWVASPEHWRYSSAHEWLPGGTPVLRCDPWL